MSIGQRCNQLFEFRCETCIRKLTSNPLRHRLASLHYVQIAKVELK